MTAMTTRSEGSEHGEHSTSGLLLKWARHQISRRVLAMRPKTRAIEIAALTAASGNPPGA